MGAAQMSLSEADTRAKLIDPAIHRRGWTEDHIRREETAGAIEPVSGRRKRGQIDYVLRVKVNAHTQPIALALIEAKKESLPPGSGLDQAKGYAKCKRLNVRFVFSSNGYQFVEYDHFIGQTSVPLPMHQFPTPQELRTRYEQGIGFALESPAARPLLQPYSGGEGTRRYYQDAAIRAVMEHIARCENAHEPKRVLLSMATGCGKTFVAVNLLKRIADAGQLTRALFLCDRDELRAQAVQSFQNVFGADTAPVYRRPDGTNNARNARIHIATYQTLGVANDDEDDANFLTTYYPENHFTHIVIDECHRSAWGKWSQVLTRNSRAVQIGLTATPRQLRCREETAEAEEAEAITANNIRYFGEPVYEYSMAQGIEDGYLAACEIQKGRVNLDDTGLTIDDIMKRNPVDALTGLPISREQVEEQYAKTAYEDRILLPDRVDALCRDLFQYLLATDGPEQKTIVFCVRDNHADEVAACMNNLYADWCATNGNQRRDPYAFKCTAASSGNDQLPDFRASSSGYFIATTVDLLTTGVDVPCVRNIVFFKYLKSPISFYQMIGRGTRIDEPTNKLTFRIYDYTDATRLFSEDFITQPTRISSGKGGDGPDESPTIIRVEGFDVHITVGGRFIVVEEDGQPVPVSLEEYKENMAMQLVQEVGTLYNFRTRWIDPLSRRELIDSLVASGYPPAVIRQVDEKEEYDLYDVLAELGWDLNPRTRYDRSQAFQYKHEDWIDGLPGRAANTIRAIAGQFAAGGTEALENNKIFQVPVVREAGGIAALQQAGIPRELLIETKRRMFAA